jgi:hypothetical protein
LETKSFQKNYYLKFTEIICKQKVMKNINLLPKLMLCILLLPYKISKGLKKSTYLKIKRILIKMDLH